MSNLYIEPSIDASYQISDQLALRFQRRRLKCEKLTDDGRQTTDAKWWQKLTLPLARWAKKGCTRLAVASDKVYQLLAHGWWFSQGIPASSTTKTGHYDIAEILLKVASNQIKLKTLFWKKMKKFYDFKSWPATYLNFFTWFMLLI